MADANRVIGERDGGATGGFCRDAAGESHHVFVLHRDLDRRGADGFVPMKPAVHAALHAQLVDRFADVGPRPAKFVAEPGEAALDRFAHSLADARLIRGGWLISRVYLAG